MGLQEIQTRLNTDKKLQLMVAAGAVVVLGLVAFLIPKPSSGGAQDTTLASPGGPGMTAPGGPPSPMMPGAPGAKPGPAAGTPAQANPTPTPAPTPAPSEAAKADVAQPAPTGPASLWKGAPRIAYRPDPFEVTEGGPRVTALAALPRIQLAPFHPRPKGLAVPVPQPLPSVRRRVAGIMLAGSISAILEEEGAQPRVIQPGDQYTHGDSVVRVERIDAGSVTLREGKTWIRVPLKGSDVASADNTNGQPNPALPNNMWAAPPPGAGGPPGVAPGGYGGYGGGKMPQLPRMRVPGGGGQVMQPPGVGVF